MDDEGARPRAPTASHGRAEVGAAAKAVRCGEHGAGRRRGSQAESSARPLRRRAARMARPARVRMRSRKPCVLARRRLFGWKVRLLTCTSPHSRLQGAPIGPGHWLSTGRSPCSGHGAAACCQACTRYVGARTRVKPGRRPLPVDNLCGNTGVMSRTFCRPARDAARPSTTGVHTARAGGEAHRPGGPTPELLIGVRTSTLSGRSDERRAERLDLPTASPQVRREWAETSRPRARPTSTQSDPLQRAVGCRCASPRGWPTGYGPVVLQSGSARHAGGRGLDAEG